VDIIHALLSNSAQLEMHALNIFVPVRKPTCALVIMFAHAELTVHDLSCYANSSENVIIIVNLSTRRVRNISEK